MSESLGLSIGVAHLVAAHAGRPLVTRSPVVTLFEHRPTEVGLPEENPNLTERGLELRGFVERVGDPTPLVASDGTKYLGEVLTVEAIEAMARAVGYGTPVTIAIPAYWPEARATALRGEFFAQPDLTRGGVPPILVSDATAALTALRAQHGFPGDGVVALCDFGAGGTSITLFDAGSNFRQIGPSVRDTDFSGDALDRLILAHVAAPRTTGNTAAAQAATARIGSQAHLLGECRRAKEQLSTIEAATVATAAGEDFQLSRTGFEQLIAGPLDRFLGSLEEALQSNRIPRAALAAVATVGGGAGIPLVGVRLSERFGVPVHTPPQPAFSAAIGAAVLGDQRASATTGTAAGPAVEAPTEMVTTARTARADSVVAWSEDDDSADPVPYTGPDMAGQYAGEAMGSGVPAASGGSGGADAEGYPAEPGGLPWYKRTALVLSLVGAGAAVLVAVLLALTLGRNKTGPVVNNPPNQPAPSQTVTVTGPNNSPTVTVVPPPPPTTQPSGTSTAPPTTTQPSGTSTAPPTTTTTTNAPSTTTTTTTPPTTTTPTPTPTTSQQTTTSQANTTASATTTNPPTTNPPATTNPPTTTN